MHATELLERSQFYFKLLPDTLLTPVQVSELQDIIREHNTLYYQQSNPIIDDREWDMLFALLRRSEEQLGIFEPDSPTCRISVLVSSQFTKLPHLAPMISLDNTYNAKEVMEFGGRVIRGLSSLRELSTILELKFDGL